ncbi:HAD family hydrolase [Maricaulaceae bacterium MS644]
MTQMRTPILAIAYDFDGTLSPGSMQEHSFIPEIGEDPATFWKRSNDEAAKLGADRTLIYMHHMVLAAERAEKPFQRRHIRAHGQTVSLFKGVEDWFDRVNAWGAERGFDVRHFVISSGLREMVLGTSIGDRFEDVFACEFKYNANDVPVWPALAVNYTTKTQFLFRINKWALDLSDDRAVNAFVPEDDRPVPFRNMIFIGDGETDVPCMRTVKANGGLSIAVHAPDDQKGAATAASLTAQDRVHLACPADYTEGSALDTYVRAAIDKMAAVERLKALERG